MTVDCRLIASQASHWRSTFKTTRPLASVFLGSILGQISVFPAVRCRCDLCRLCVPHYSDSAQRGQCRLQYCTALPRRSRCTFFSQTVKKPHGQTKLAVADPEGCHSSDAPLPLRALLVWPVLLSVANYALLAVLDIAYRAVQPLFFSTPIALGGLGQPPARIGVMLATLGVGSGVFQATCFPKLIDRFGPRRLFLLGMFMFGVLYALFPVINHVAARDGVTLLVWVLVAIQLSLSVACDMAYGEHSTLSHMYPRS